MRTTNGTADMLIEQYNEILGNSDQKDDSRDSDRRELQIEYYSAYEKTGYETHAYSNLTNIKL